MSSPFVKSVARDRMERQGQWFTIESLLGGTVGMRQAGKVLLPQRAKEPEQFYRTRLNSSVLFEAFKDAVGAIVAKPFSKAIRINGELPLGLEGMLTDIDGEGTSLDSFVATLYGNAWSYGGTHVVVDYPPRPEEAVTLADERALALRPYFSLVTAQDLLGVRYVRQGSRVTLTQARIQEMTTEDDGAFGDAERRRVRVMSVENGVVVWRVWEEGASGVPSSTSEGVMTLPYIPLHTYYVNRVGVCEYLPPLSGLASLNVAHWQSSSLQRNSLDIARCPVLVLLGMPTDQSGSGEPEPVVVGANTSFQSQNTDAKAFYCEHTGAALAAGHTDLKELREQMEVMAMQPWLQRPSHTATGIVASEGKSECAVQRSVRELETFVRDLFVTAAAWIGEELPEDFSIDIYDDFGISPTRAQDVQSLIQVRAAREISHETFLSELKKRAVLSEDVDIDAEIERTAEERATVSAAFGGGFDFGGQIGDGQRATA